MKIFIDTANIDEISEIAKWGILEGVTTNPSLIAKEGRDFKEVVKEICEIVDGPISAEVISTKWEDMVKEAKELAKIHKNIIIKVPMTEEGLIAVKELKKNGIKTNVTLIFSVGQALLAAKAGASYVSPFLGRLDDIGVDSEHFLKNVVEVFSKLDEECEIIAASIRNMEHVTKCARIGADIATVPYKVLKDMTKHPLTDAGIARFLKDWEGVK
ncbi:fructose-6-phosphate aldolase [Clostridiales bacterium KA00134]|nr:fructose-6-phosphate aldolase [Clostridiales bacterium KA00134]